MGRAELVYPSPHASTAAWPNIYAIAIAAIGPVTPITLSRLRPPYIAYIDCAIATPFNHGANHMKQLIIGITVVLAFHVGNVEAAQWVPLDEAEDGQRIRTNNGPEEGRIICTSKTRGKGKGIPKMVDGSVS